VNDERLGQLLTDADAAAPPPQLANELSTRVRGRLRRRQISARLAGAGVAVILAAAVLLIQHNTHPLRAIVRSPHPSDGVPLEQLRAEVIQLASDAAVHERVADALLRGREQSLRQQKWRRALDTTSEDPGRVIQEARDRAAEILVRDADRMPPDSLHALQEYRYVAQLFPNTPAGKQATLKLKSQGV
jgi:hypothetical protein